ncbi:MAG: alpha amylase C-terminal domain-containing protein [Bacteroidales bacterium]|nr:alpha amylase C-terminal domain-containing protein [Bacteroidales bacterium]
MQHHIPVMVQEDPWLNPYKEIIYRRQLRARDKERELIRKAGCLSDFATGYLFFGLHRTDAGWVLREWAPNAKEIFLTGSFSGWKETEQYRMERKKHGVWELCLPNDAIHHQDLYKLSVYWEGGHGYRIPSYVRRVIQEEDTKLFNAQVWAPDHKYHWHNPPPDTAGRTPLIYETHVGMCTQEEKTGTFNEFRESILPRIKDSGYNTIQLMAIQEHPYYGSFGYHVSNYFAVSSRFGTPEELKMLVDCAHGMDIAVIMDIVHSHAVKNELEGLGNFDGTTYQYFHTGARREHVAWDSLCFNYGKNEVLHFLLSNCKFWLEEYHFDGFRFDGVTSMLYYDHGLSRNFTSYEMYYDGQQDEDAIVYVTLANALIQEVNPRAVTIAEEMSGMPGISVAREKGGYGFDYRMAMGIPDYWIKIIKEQADEHWNVSEMYHELTQKRHDEKTVSYAESHDQALVGDKTIIFRLLDQEMYFNMSKDRRNLIIDRGMALHKMIRFITAATAGGGYLNFMGNEFGHPEWIDFPREGNGWSYKYARRQWNLVDDRNLNYHFLGDFDKAMIRMIRKEDLLKYEYCRLLTDNRTDQVLAFERKDIMFVFNFNPVRSYTDYGIPVTQGKYRIILNSDHPEFGGFGHVDEQITYFSRSGGRASSPHHIMLYLPSRTGIALKRHQTRRVH